MGQIEQIKVLDSIEGRSIVEIRAALQHLGHDRDVRTYAVRVLQNGNTFVIFATEDDKTREIAVRDGVVLSTLEARDFNSHFKTGGRLA